MLPQWHVKDPGHSARSAGGRLHLNMHTPLTQRSRSRLTMSLSRHSVGSYQKTSSPATRQGTPSQSSQLTELLWTDPGIKSGISEHVLLSTSTNKQKKHRQGMTGRIFSQNPRKRGKSHHHHHQNRMLVLDACSERNILWAVCSRD